MQLRPFCNGRFAVHRSPWLVRSAMLVAIVLALIAIISGFWLMAPLVIVLGLLFAIAWTRRSVR